MSDAIWVLGATGRSGQGIAALLRDAGYTPTLVGRDRARLEDVASALGGNPPIVVGELDDVLGQITAARPAVVVSTVGPFATTAPKVIAACPPKTHYVDISNELAAMNEVLELNETAVAGDQTFVAGAGFGVLATESVLLKLCEGMPAPETVRVDAMAAVASEPGRMGVALAGTIIDSFGEGGWGVESGQLVRASLTGTPEHLTTPTGDAISTGPMPSGELIAAWKSSGAKSVVAASSMVPTGRSRSALPAVALLMRSAALRRFATRRLANMQFKRAPMPRENSWSHARVEWASGETREGWMKCGDGMDFTVAVASTVAIRLARGEGRPGAFTPGALFGPSLATDAGGEFVL